MGISRRTFLALGASVVVGACTNDSGGGASPSTGASPTPEPAAPTSTAAGTTTEATTTTTSTTTTTTVAATTTTVAELPTDPFALGVTSGDPDESSAVLWTRLIGVDLPAEVDVTWEVAGDDSFADVTATGAVTAAGTDAHSVHVIADLAGPSWYRFTAGGWTSPVGRVAPTPAGASELRVATASCQHWETGYYAAHRDLSEWEPDLVAFLGDFIYEGATNPTGPDRVRSHDGPEITDLAAYRARYAQYLSDPDLQAARAVAPWLVVWDDHEVENNYAALSPEAAVDAAAFPNRRDQAYQAWWEHMPVRLPRPEPGGYAIHRAVRWGGLAEVVLLDGRQYRSDQACGSPTLSTEPACPEAFDPARTMLGAEQEEWLGATLAASTATWPVIAQQTVMTGLRLGEAILNYDQWDGYGPARDRLLLQAAATERTIVLSGDIHLAGVGRLPGVGVEFVTASISSQGNVDPELQPILDQFVDVVASELVHRGYVRHTVTPTTWTAEYRTVDDVLQAASPVSTWRTFRVDAMARDVVVDA